MVPSAAFAPDAAIAKPGERSASAQTPGTAAANDQPAPVRVYSETTAQGQAVWIAMRADGDSVDSAMPQILAQLRQDLARRGQRLAQLVCNGRLVWTAPTGVDLPFPYQPDDKEP